MAFIPGLAASEIVTKAAILSEVRETKVCLTIIARADVSPGRLTVSLDPNELSKTFECDPNQIDADALLLTAPFRMRRRGVELNLHLGEAPSEVDQTLVWNIVSAQRWLAMIIDGKSFTRIAQSEGTPMHRVQDVIDLAMLAPGVLDAVVSGEQPDGLTSDFLIKSGVPTLRSDPRSQFAEL